MIHNEHEVFTSCQASLSQELRKTKQQLQLSELQKQKLLTSLQDGHPGHLGQLVSDLKVL
jgi:hypothetical protein